MRCAPYAIAFGNDPDRLVEVSRQSSAITHADSRCQWSCALFNRTLANLLADEDRPLETAKTALESELPEEVNQAVDPVLASRHGSRDTINPENSGYVVTTLQAGLYHGLTADSAEEAIVDAVMMGGDTDTIGAVAGAIAGTRFGVDALPEHWLDSLAVGNELDTLASQLPNIDP